MLVKLTLAEFIESSFVNPTMILKAKICAGVQNFSYFNTKILKIFKNKGCYVISNSNN
jgi:hypothetical protein